MATHYKAHTFRRDDAWETIDTYWSSPLSYWSQKSMRIEPPVALRVTILGKVVEVSHAGWINYGGPWAMFVQSVQAKGHAGQRVRAEISDETIHEDEW
ncbi:MAG TPA: hypothetical protein VG755_19950 [Nannocystaceae bacterium]|jgi:hypothetical protein|nr:hypothetical protein [Nannocystaceae bacterium]